MNWKKNYHKTRTIFSIEPINIHILSNYSIASSHCALSFIYRAANHTACCDSSINSHIPHRPTMIGHAIVCCYVAIYARYSGSAVSSILLLLRCCSLLDLSINLSLDMDYSPSV